MDFSPNIKKVIFSAFVSLILIIPGLATFPRCIGGCPFSQLFPIELLIIFIPFFIAYSLSSIFDIR